MDHVVYVDAKAKELDRLLSGEKTMILRGAAGRKMPYGRVQVDDVLYLIKNNAEGVVKACGTVTTVLNSEKMDRETSVALVDAHQEALQLTPAQVKRWAGKRYLVLIGVEGVAPVDAFPIDRSAYGNMDDWLPVGEINTVRGS
jgi:hypothetical protein